jgi:Domain of unknown function (DUF4365)
LNAAHFPLGTILITLQHTEECISLAYVHALTGKAGVSLSAHRVHDYGIDGTFRSVKIVGTRRVESGFAVDFQMKATVNWEHQQTNVMYDLEAKTYNDLVQREKEATPCILILLCLPPNQDDWVNTDEKQMVLKHCCYWVALQGPVTTNTSKKRIWIPRETTLTSKAIAQILDAERNKRLGV